MRLKCDVKVNQIPIDMNHISNIEFIVVTDENGDGMLLRKDMIASVRECKSDKDAIITISIMHPKTGDVEVIKLRDSFDNMVSKLKYGR